MFSLVDWQTSVFPFNSRIAFRAHWFHLGWTVIWTKLCSIRTQSFRENLNNSWCEEQLHLAVLASSHHRNVPHSSSVLSNMWQISHIMHHSSELTGDGIHDIRYVGPAVCQWKKNRCNNMFPLCPTITVLLASLFHYTQTNDTLWCIITRFSSFYQIPPALAKHHHLIMLDLDLNSTLI